MNIMLDLETMGNGPDAAIIAVGACKFDTIGVLDTYYCVVDLTSSLNAGLKVDGIPIYRGSNNPTTPARLSILP